MRSHLLYWPALAIAALCAVIVVISPFSEFARQALVPPMTAAASSVTVALFLRVLLDRRCVRGILAASRQIQGDQPFRFRWIGFTDFQWGLFGFRAGPRPLLIVRAALLIEFIIALMLAGTYRPDILFLAGAAFAAAIMLSLIHLELNTTATLS